MVTDRTLDLSRAALGSLVAGYGDPASFDAEDFPDLRHRAILDAVRDCGEQREWTLVRQVLALSGHPRAFWEDELAAIPEHAVAANNLPVIRRMLRSARRRREMLSGARGLVSGLESGADDPALIAQVQMLDALSRESGDHEITPIADGMADVFLQKDRPPVPLGLDSLWNLRVRAGDLCVYAARPGVGKTAMLGTTALCAAHGGWSVLFLSLEMPSLQIRQRFLAGYSGIPLHDIQTQADPRMASEAPKLSALPIWLEDEKHKRLGIEAILAHAQSFVRMRGAERTLVMIDYLQLITSRVKHEKRYELIGHVCRELKHLAVSLEVPVITAAQLSRNAENRDGLPRLADLRESGDIEQTADSVVLIHREESDSWLKVAKQRQGPCFKAEATYDGPLCLFIDKSAG